MMHVLAPRHRRARPLNPNDRVIDCYHYKVCLQETSDNYRLPFPTHLDRLLAKPLVAC